MKDVEMRAWMSREEYRDFLVERRAYLRGYYAGQRSMQKDVLADRLLNALDKWK
jgi:hypothetical protein